MVAALTLNSSHNVTGPFTPARMDASQEQTDVECFAVREPVADGFRNYLKGKYTVPAEALLVDKAQLLTLTAPEMTVLVGGMRVLKTNFGGTQHGVFTKRPEALTNDFFVNLLDMGTVWQATAEDHDLFEGRDRATGEIRWTSTFAGGIWLGSVLTLTASLATQYPPAPLPFTEAASAHALCRGLVGRWQRLVCRIQSRTMRMPASISARTAITRPTPMISTALSRGRRFTRRPSPENRSISGRAFTISTPMAISTAANPRLKARISSRPKAMRCRDTAINKITKAPGQGTMPPEMPRVSRLPREAPVRGAWGAALGRGSGGWWNWYAGVGARLGPGGARG